MRTTWKPFSNKTKLTFLFSLTLLFSTLIFSTPSYGEWTKAGKGGVAGLNLGDTFYVDFERIRNHDGYVYYWGLSDNLKPIAPGYFSAVSYMQGDCKLFRFKNLSMTFYKEPMGGGIGKRVNINGDNADWIYTPPHSVAESILQQVCNH